MYSWVVVHTTGRLFKLWWSCGCWWSFRATTELGCRGVERGYWRKPHQGPTGTQSSSSGVGKKESVLVTQISCTSLNVFLGMLHYHSLKLTSISSIKNTSDAAFTNPVHSVPQWNHQRVQQLWGCVSCQGFGSRAFWPFWRNFTGLCVAVAVVTYLAARKAHFISRTVNSVLHSSSHCLTSPMPTESIWLPVWQPLSMFCSLLAASAGCEKQRLKERELSVNLSSGLKKVACASWLLKLPSDWFDPSPRTLWTHCLVVKWPQPTCTCVASPPGVIGRRISTLCTLTCWFLIGEAGVDPPSHWVLASRSSSATWWPQPAEESRFSVKHFGSSTCRFFLLHCNHYFTLMNIQFPFEEVELWFSDAHQAKKRKMKTLTHPKLCESELI